MDTRPHYRGIDPRPPPPRPGAGPAAFHGRAAAPPPRATGASLPLPQSLFPIPPVNFWATWHQARAVRENRAAGPWGGSGLRASRPTPGPAPQEPPAPPRSPAALARAGVTVGPRFVPPIERGAPATGQRGHVGSVGPVPPGRSASSYLCRGSRRRQSPPRLRRARSRSRGLPWRRRTGGAGEERRCAAQAARASGVSVSVRVCKCARLRQAAAGGGAGAPRARVGGSVSRGRPRGALRRAAAAAAAAAPRRRRCPGRRRCPLRRPAATAVLRRVRTVLHRRSEGRRWEDGGTRGRPEVWALLELGLQLPWGAKASQGAGAVFTSPTVHAPHPGGRAERAEPPGAAERWAEWNGSFPSLGVGGCGGPAWYLEGKVGTTGKRPQSFNMQSEGKSPRYTSHFCTGAPPHLPMSPAVPVWGRDSPRAAAVQPPWPGHSHRREPRRAGPARRRRSGGARRGLGSRGPSCSRSGRGVLAPSDVLEEPCGCPRMSLEPRGAPGGFLRHSGLGTLVAPPSWLQPRGSRGPGGQTGRAQEQLSLFPSRRLWRQPELPFPPSRAFAGAFPGRGCLSSGTGGISSPGLGRRPAGPQQVSRWLCRDSWARRAPALLAARPCAQPGASLCFL